MCLWVVSVLRHANDQHERKKAPKPDQLLMRRRELGARPAAHHPQHCGEQNGANDGADQAARTQMKPVARDQTRE